MSILQNYLKDKSLEKVNIANIAYLANLEKVSEICPEIAKSIVAELDDQRRNLKLIASENFSSLSVQSAMGNLLTDKYAEGFSHHRFYAGCDNIDDIEDLACKEAKVLFGAEHAYVQPHSGADANLVAFWAILRTKIQVPELTRLNAKTPLELDKSSWDELRRKLGNQRLYALDLYSGGHLTHGYRMNVSAQMFDVYQYGVHKETGLLDYDAMRKGLKEIKPLIFLVGYSAYPRAIDFSVLREMTDEVGAVLMVDMAHFSGLVAGEAFSGTNNPIPYADVVTSTTHKTLRGPRGGFVLCKNEYAESVDKGCPLVIGGPIPHMMAAKAVAFREARTPEFKEYAKNIVSNSRALGKALIDHGLKLVSNGTDNHLVLIDLRELGITGRQAESALRECAITLNRNAIPNDPNGPWYTSGLRIGTPSVTTLGMGETEMSEIANLVATVLRNIKPEEIDGKISKAKYILAGEISNNIKQKVSNLLNRFTLYPELDLEFMKAAFK